MWRLSLAICVMATATPAFAQANTNGHVKLFASMAKLQSTLIDWFDQISNSADNIADKEDKRRMLVAFQHLQKSVYNVETDGRDLLIVLQQKPLDEAKAMKVLGDTGSDLQLLRTDLHQSGVQLINQDRAGGATAEQLISDVIANRALWLSDVADEIRNHRVSPETIHEGNEVIQRQWTATAALGEVIEKLSK